jgi:hypothetical protein
MFFYFKSFIFSQINKILNKKHFINSLNICFNVAYFIYNGQGIPG